MPTLGFRLGKLRTKMDVVLLKIVESPTCSPSPAPALIGVFLGKVLEECGGAGGGGTEKGPGML